MIAIKNILVATDFSEPSAVALDYGRELARAYNATLHLLHVADDLNWRYSLDMTAGLMADVQEDLEATARERLDRQLSDEDRDQLRARAIVITAPSASETIVGCAQAHGIDVIIMGTHGRGGLAHALMGSVAERVVRTAPCPVLTVRSPQHGFVRPDALMSVAKA